MDNEEIRAKIAELKGFIYTELGWIAPESYKNGCIPNWPEEIADAWSLLESNEIYGYKVLKPVSYPYGYQCWIMPKIHPMHKFSSIADTAPLAICLAYIAWKESQK